MRLLIMLLIDQLLGREIRRCTTCSKRLSTAEIEYYGFKCEKCESKMMKLYEEDCDD